MISQEFQKFLWQLEALSTQFDELASDTADKRHWNWVCLWLNQLLEVVLPQGTYRTFPEEWRRKLTIEFVLALRDKLAPYVEEEIAIMREIGERNYELYLEEVAHK
jgi:hypothetical protein